MVEMKELYEIQKVLDKHIEKVHPAHEYENRLYKKILALLVELGECANEWRGFKFWSIDQEPRTEVLIVCDECGGSGRNHSGYCGSCHGGYVGKENPLLEEYVDCLHFILSIGNDLGYRIDFAKRYEYESIERQFKELFWEISDLEKASSITDYTSMFAKFAGLGNMLGFTWIEIEQAYLSKNEINHERQDKGY